MFSGFNTPLKSLAVELFNICSTYIQMTKSDQAEYTMTVAKLKVLFLEFTIFS